MHTSNLPSTYCREQVWQTLLFASCATATAEDYSYLGIRNIRNNIRI